MPTWNFLLSQSRDLKHGSYEVNVLTFENAIEVFGLYKAQSLLIGKRKYGDED